MSMRRLIEGLEEPKQGGMSLLISRMMETDEYQSHPSVVNRLLLKNAPAAKSSLSDNDLKGLKKEWDDALSECESGLSDLRKIMPAVRKIIDATGGRLIYSLSKKSQVESLGMTTKQIKELAIEHGAAFGKWRDGMDTLYRIWRKIEDSVSNIQDLRKAADDQHGYYSFKTDVTAGSDVRASWDKLTGGSAKYDIVTYRDSWRTADSFADTAFYGSAYACKMTVGKIEKNCKAGTMSKKFAKDFKDWEAELV